MGTDENVTDNIADTLYLRFMKFEMPVNEPQLLFQQGLLKKKNEAENSGYHRRGTTWVFGSTLECRVLGTTMRLKVRHV